MDIPSQHANEQLFDLFSAGIVDKAICMVDESGIIKAWNAGAEKFYGYSSAEIVNKPIADLLNGFDISGYLSQAYAGGDSNFETEVYRNNGSHFPAHFTLQPIYNKNKLLGYGLTASSLAYTRRMQYRFEENEKANHRSGLFQQLIEHSYSGVTLFDEHFNFIYRSPSAARITGFNDSGRADTAFNEIIHPQDKARVKDLLDELLQKPGASITCKLRSRHFDGHFIDLEGVFTNWLQQPDIRAIVLNFRDVTKEQRAEDALQQTIAELSAYKYALDVSAIVAITDHTGIIKHVNNNFCKISGYTEQELLGQDHRIIKSGYHDKSFMRDLWRTIASGRIWEGEICNRRKDGTIYWVSSTIVPFLNEHGKPYQYLSIRFDQTEARFAKQELIEKNKQISSLLESINDAFIGVDSEMRYTYVNQRTCDLVGLSAESILGRKMWDVFPDAVGSNTWKAIEQARATGLPVINEDYYEPLGLWQENHIYPNDSGLSIFISDITVRKREERQKTLLSDISDIFSKRALLPQLMQQVLTRLAGVNSIFCLAEVWQISRDGKHLMPTARAAIGDTGLSFFSNGPDLRRLSVGEGLPGATWKSGEVEFWPDLKNDTRFLRSGAASTANLTAAFGLPLRNNGALIGVMLLGQTSSEAPDSLRKLFMEQLGDHLGSNITRRQLENDLQNIFEAAHDIICIVGVDRYFKKVNPAMCDLLGYSEAELLAMSIDELIHKDDLTESRERMRKFINDDIRSLYFENRYCHKTGRIIYLAWTVAKGKEEDILFCVAKDITDKKVAEETATKFLKERNTILESIGDAFFSVDRNWVVQYWNHIAEDALKTPKEHILGKNLWEVFADAVTTESYTQYHRAISTGKAAHFEEYYNPLSVWYEVNAYPSDNGLSVFFRDISSRKQAEQDLKEQAEALAISHQHYSDLFDLSPMPKFVFDNETLAILDVNKAAVNHYGYTKKELLKMSLRDIRPVSELPNLEKAVNAAGRGAYFYQPGIFTHKKKNGELIKVEIISSALDYNGRPARIALAMDVTERLEHVKAIEEQNARLREISWMQSHIIRAPLSRIMGLIELFKVSAPDEKEIAEILEYIKLSANELDDAIRTITHSADI